MPGCATCRHRKVKCDGRTGTCVRCEKIGVPCQWTVQLDENGAVGLDRQEALTQAGYKRLRTSVACDPCRKRKAKCDALRPSCGTCLRLKSSCSYEGGGGSPERLSEHVSPHRRMYGFGRIGSVERSHDVSSEALILALSSQPPSGSAILPYIDAFLQNVHPVGCNNFIHGGLLGEVLEKAPRMLTLALCGVTAKFTQFKNGQEQGRLWIEEAKSLAFKSLDSISTLNISVLQFLATHEMQEGNFMSAWNLIGIGSRMALQLKLNRPTARQPSEMSSAEFLRMECHSRLMWTVFVSDLLHSDEGNISEDAMACLYLPCNLWSFTQGTPCTTLRLSEVSESTADSKLRQATNPCAYLIKILAIRRKIINFVRQHQLFDAAKPWRTGSYFQTLCEEHTAWRSSLPANFAFEERNMFTFRASSHLDIFLMIHVWYYQSGCELFGDWMNGDGDSLSLLVNAQDIFRQQCRDNALAHAKGFSHLVKKILKVEPDHLFRDAWFGICLLDSSRIQIAGLEGESGQSLDEMREEVVDNMKLHLQALVNTKRTISLAEKIYGEVYALIQRAELGEVVGLDVPNFQRADELRPESAVAFFRRYPFLEPAPALDLSGWDELFNATNFGGSMAATREESPECQDDPVSGRRQKPLAAQLLSSISNIPQDLPDQFYSTPWPPDQFQWQSPGASQGIINANNGQALDESSIMGIDHGILGFSADSFTDSR